MDSKTIQPSIDALNAEIARLVSARDTLVGLLQPAKPRKIRSRKAPAGTQREQWAEQKRRQRAKKEARK